MRGNFIKLHFQTIQFHALLSSTCFPSGIKFVKGRQPARVYLFLSLLSISRFGFKLGDQTSTVYIKRKRANMHIPATWPASVGCDCTQTALKVAASAQRQFVLERELENRTSSSSRSRAKVRARARARGRGWGATSGRHLCVDTSKMKVQCTLSVSLRCATSAFHRNTLH